MERLTERHYVKEHGHYMKCTEDCYLEDTECGDCQKLDKLVDRLGAYEDTELTPGEVAEYKKFEDEAVSKGVPFSRIVELMNADKDGRLVVLPCKVGDTVFVNGTKRTVQATINEAYLDNAEGVGYLVSCTCDVDCNGCPFNDWKQDYSGEYSCDAEWGDASIMGADFGKTAFLTYEEAEQALKEAKQ